MLPASVLYGGQEGLKPLSFKMCAFQGEKPLTNRLLIGYAVALAVQRVLLGQAGVQSGNVVGIIGVCCHGSFLL